MSRAFRFKNCANPVTCVGTCSGQTSCLSRPTHEWADLCCISEGPSGAQPDKMWTIWDRDAGRRTWNTFTNRDIHDNLDPSEKKCVKWKMCVLPDAKSIPNNISKHILYNMSAVYQNISNIIEKKFDFDPFSAWLSYQTDAYGMGIWLHGYLIC